MQAERVERTIGSYHMGMALRAIERRAESDEGFEEHLEGLNNFELD
jgi:hypothetical protein